MRATREKHLSRVLHELCHSPDESSSARSQQTLSVSTCLPSKLQGGQGKMNAKQNGNFTPGPRKEQVYLTTASTVMNRHIKLHWFRVQYSLVNPRKDVEQRRLFSYRLQTAFEVRPVRAFFPAAAATCRSHRVQFQVQRPSRASFSI